MEADSKQVKGAESILIHNGNVVLGMQTPSRWYTLEDGTKAGIIKTIGGKIEKENDGLNEAYRELYEETNISNKDISLEHFMNIEYISFDKMIEVYYGVLNKEVQLVEEVNKLEWVMIDDDFFDMNRYAGEGNIGHIIEEIKIYLSKSN